MKLIENRLAFSFTCDIMAFPNFVQELLRISYMRQLEMMESNKKSNSATKFWQPWLENSGIHCILQYFHDFMNQMAYL